MCGILCHISAVSHAETGDEDIELLSRRGPDSLHLHQTIVRTGSRVWYLTFSSSVLSLRGNAITKQPMVDDGSGSVFCWNGEAWRFANRKIPGNDTTFIAEQLLSCLGGRRTAEDAVTEVIGSIQGPFAFVYFDGRANKLYFGRDPLGRRSLLTSIDFEGTNELTISSVPLKKPVSVVKEVLTLSVQIIDLNEPELAILNFGAHLFAPQINRNLPSPDGVLPGTPSTTSIHDLHERLSEAVRVRVQAIPTYTPKENDTSTTPAKVAILFSGGLDCTIVARICHDILPVNEPVDLLNVAFENPRVMNARAKESNMPTESSLYEACPDRITGRSSFAELSRVCPERAWRFVAIDIPYHDFQEHRSTIVHLMHPHNTEMDLSITAALYFAARGKGHIAEQGNTVSEYTTTARVLLSGLGADELFGGYARHAAAFTRGGYEALNDELELDFRRIGARNLGRDDRVIAHWGRETRYPFLDENFVKFALGLPAWEKCGFRVGKAVPKHFESPTVAKCMEDLHPEKMLLRCALWHLGVPGAAAEKKRAIQFGARTAKMIGGKTKGTDVVT